MVISPSSLPSQRAQKKYFYLKNSQNKSTKIIYLMYKTKDYFGFYNNNNSECNRCEAVRIRNSFHNQNNVQSQTKQLIELSFITSNPHNPNQPCSRQELKCKAQRFPFSEYRTTLVLLISFLIKVQGLQKRISLLKEQREQY